MSPTPRRWVLSGGIGSGKSEVRRLLAEGGIRTIEADAVGHTVLGNEGFAPVAARWPQVVFEGQIDRQALARVVFADPEQLAELEAITHPLIFGRIESELEGFLGAAIVEMPLLNPELGWPVIVVDAEDEVRLARGVGRGMDPRDVSARMSAQPSRAAWLAEAQLVIPNHRSKGELQRSVRRVIAFLSQPDEQSVVTRR